MLDGFSSHPFETLNPQPPAGYPIYFITPQMFVATSANGSVPLDARCWTWHGCLKWHRAWNYSTGGHFEYGPWPTEPNQYANPQARANEVQSERIKQLAVEVEMPPIELGNAIHRRGGAFGATKIVELTWVLAETLLMALEDEYRRRFRAGQVSPEFHPASNTLKQSLLACVTKFRLSPHEFAALLRSQGVANVEDMNEQQMTAAYWQIQQRYATPPNQAPPPPLPTR